MFYFHSFIPESEIWVLDDTASENIKIDECMNSVLSQRYETILFVTVYPPVTILNEGCHIIHISSMFNALGMRP